MKAHALAAAFLALATSIPAVTVAHPGGLNAEGCYNDRKLGGYHCHRPGAAPARAPAKKSHGLSSAGVHYAKCTKARAAGAAPLRWGEQGYWPAMDRGNDGVACE